MQDLRMQNPPASWAISLGGKIGFPALQTWLGLALCGLSLISAPGWAVEPEPSPTSTQNVHITLLQLNDVYEIAPVDHGQHGGLARVATLRKKIQAENPNTYLILAGDTLSPSIASQLFQGKQMVDLWNQLGLDVATLGNHEFDFGNDVLRKRLQESHFPWVIANVRDRQTGQPFAGLPPYTIKTINGLKVGFFGLLTPDTEHSSRPGADIQFTDPVYTACETVAKMRQEGVEVIVAITHLPMNEDQRMARNMHHHVALIMGGHEHTLLESVAGGVPIIKVGSDARTLGRIDLFVDGVTHQVEHIDWQMIPVDASVPEDPTVSASVQRYEAQVNDALGQTLGQTTVALDALQAHNRSQETNLGNFLADVYRAKWGADVALLNGGSIRSNATYGPGPLTRRDIMSILPFNDPVVKLSISGETLKKALENGVSRLEEKEAGRFPQVSGLRFGYLPSAPVGNRVMNLTINGKPCSPKQLYTLALPNYLREGGDDYDMFKSAAILGKGDDGTTDAALVQAALQQSKTISPQVDGRIQRLSTPSPQKKPGSI